MKKRTYIMPLLDAIEVRAEQGFAGSIGDGNGNVTGSDIEQGGDDDL